MTHYTLDADGYPVEEPDVLKWAKWFESATADQSRVVARTELPGDVIVSTVFLGLDHGWGFGKPVLWETMIFKGDEDGYQERYSSHEEALQGHERAVRVAKGEEQP